MARPGPLIQRERRTVAAMIRLYCRRKHGRREALCESCQAIHDYAMDRLGRCPFQERKPTCAGCRVHCYKEPQRSQIRDIMRFSGPRMLPRHPVLAIRHLLDGLKRPP